MEPRLDKQGIDLPADQRVATGPPLQLDQAVDCGVGRLAFGMEVRRTVVALDNGDRAAWPEQAFENRQRSGGPGEMLQDEADEDMIERAGLEGRQMAQRAWGLAVCFRL